MLKLKLSSCLNRLVLLAAICNYSISSAQIPVTDGANLGQNIQQVLSWAKQLEAMSDQYNQQMQQYKALTGNRGMGNLFNNPALRQYLPPEWQQVYQSLQNSGLAGLSSGAQAIRQQYGLTYDCSAIRIPSQKRQCEIQMGKNAQDADIFQTALKSANLRTQVISDLQGQINSADDPKAIAELQARIQAEQANLQNEMSKMHLSIQLAEIQNKLFKQKEVEDLRQRMSNR